MTGPESLEDLIAGHLAELVQLYRIVDGRRGTGRPLSALELKVVAQAAAGRTNRQIAAAMHYSEDGIKGVLRTAFAKLGIRRRGELAGALAAAS